MSLEKKTCIKAELHGTFSTYLTYEQTKTTDRGLRPDKAEVAECSTKQRDMVGSFNINSAYMEMLTTLSNEDKIDLVSRLVKSMKTAIAPKAKAKDVFAGFSSDWGEGMTTEEYSDMLRNENTANLRTVENW